MSRKSLSLPGGLTIGGFFFVLTCVLGCQNEDSIRDRQDRALRDPFSYGPQIDPPRSARPSPPPRPAAIEPVEANEQ